MLYATLLPGEPRGPCGEQIGPWACVRAEAGDRNNTVPNFKQLYASVCHTVV